MKTSVYNAKPETTIDDYTDKIEEIKQHIGNCLEGKTNEEKVLITIASLNNNGIVTHEQILIEQRAKNIYHTIHTLNHKSMELANEVFEVMSEGSSVTSMVDEDLLTVWVTHPANEQTYTYELDEE